MKNQAVNEGILNVRKKGSNVYREGPHMLPAVSLMLAEGVLTSIDDLKKPFVTIVNSYTNQIPGHAHLDQLGQILKSELEKQDVNVWYANIGGAVGDGIAMGHYGMKYSLPSRELITDQIETIIGAHPPDAWIGLGNCDKIVPAMYNAMVRINIPSLYVSGGPMRCGENNTDLISVFEAVGKYSSGKINKEELEQLTATACPGFGSCAGMFTANSMNCLGEVLGFALPGNGTIPATEKVEGKKRQFTLNPERVDLIKQAARKIVHLMKNKIKPLDILNRESIDNAFILDLAMGGSTNTVLHLLGLAHEAGIGYDLKYLNELAQTTPNVVKVSPSRPEVHIEDIHKVGGMGTMRSVYETKQSKLQLKAKTLYGTLEDLVFHSPEPDGEIIRPADKAFSSEGGLAVLFGNIARDGSVVKTSGVDEDMLSFTGEALVYNSQEEALEAILNNKVKDEQVVVILYEGPRGGPGMQEMLSPTSAISGANIKAALITDGRFSGGTRGLCVGHISPEAASGGEVGLIKNGDLIEIDVKEKKIQLKVSDKELAERKKNMKRFTSKVKGGWLARYARFVQSADKGAVLSL
jgi:dihydroxy-acid dehydratase